MTKFVINGVELYFVSSGDDFVGAEFHFVVNELYIVTAEFDFIVFTSLPEFPEIILSMVI